MCQWVGKKLYRKKKCQTLQLFMYQFLQEVAKNLIQKKNWILENRRETATTKPCEAG
jgi:hypothetical protein